MGRLTMLPPPLTGMPYAINRTTAAKPFYYAAPPPDGDGNYSANFAIWDGSLDGPAYTTTSFSLGKYVGDDFWGVNSAAGIDRWQIGSDGISLSQVTSPQTFPDFKPGTKGGSAVAVSASKVRYLFTRWNGGYQQLSGYECDWSGSALTQASQDDYVGCGAGNYDIGVHSIGGCQMTAGTLAVFACIYISYSGNCSVYTRNVLVITAGGGEPGVFTLLDDKVEGNATHIGPGRAYRVNDTLAMALYFRYGSWQLAVLDTTGARGNIVSLGTGFLGAAPLSSSRVVVAKSNTVDVYGLSGVSLTLLKSTTGLTFPTAVVGVARLSATEFLVFTKDGTTLKATRCAIDAGDTVVQGQTVVIDTSGPTIQNVGFSSVVLPNNRVMVHYGDGIVAGNWKTKILRSAA